MRSFFNHPYPSIYDQKEKLLSAGLFGIFVMAFLLIFQPFGISDSTDALFLVKTAGYGVVTFAVLLVMYYFLPKVYPSYFEEQNYTVGKELLLSAVLILLIGFANSMYAYMIIPEPYGQSIVRMIWQTFLVGIFPLSFLTLIQYNRLDKSNRKSSAEINLNTPLEEKIWDEKRSPEFYKVNSEQSSLVIAVESLLFIESDGNYIYLNEIKDGRIEKNMYRITLKTLIEENSNLSIVRCHRSFIVNLDKVIEVNGNAQGLKLTIANSDYIIPVSRKYITRVKNYLNHKK